MCTSAPCFTPWPLSSHHCCCRSQKTATTGDGASKSDETTVTFTLESNDVSQIDDFISAAYESYRQMIKGGRDNKEEQQR